MNFTLPELEAFFEVTRLGSFTRAARILNMSQPALTVRIRHLEQALGVRLLDRTTRSVTLTQTGKEFFPSVERVLREVAVVAESAKDVADRRRRLVTVAAIPSLAATLLPRIVAAFQAEHPAVIVRLRDGVGQRVLNLVKSGEADFGIGSPTRRDAGLRITPLAMDPLCAVFPAGHTLEQRSTIRLEDLLTVPLILMDPGYTVRTLIDIAFESISQPVTPVHEAAYVPTALGLVGAGLGVAVLACSAADRTGIETGGLATRVIDHPMLVRHIAVIESATRSLSPAATQFLNTVSEVCQRQSA